MSEADSVPAGYSRRSMSARLKVWRWPSLNTMTSELVFWGGAAKVRPPAITSTERTAKGAVLRITIESPEPVYECGTCFVPEAISRVCHSVYSGPCDLFLLLFWRRCRLRHRPGCGSRCRPLP